MNGGWTITAREYVGLIYRYSLEIGSLKWAAPMDWMCEPFMLAKTRGTVKEHQRKTLESYLELRGMRPDMPVIPVLQGWGVGDYIRHAEDYQKAGVDLGRALAVGVGSVCRRQGTREAAEIFSSIRALGLGNIHAFGVKILGLKLFGDKISSCDSMAWSIHARRQKIKLNDCKHTTCANCMKYALRWRDGLISLQRGAA